MKTAQAEGPKAITRFDEMLAHRILNIRKERGISQSEVARFIGVSLAQYQKYEQGLTRITAYRLVKISNCIHVPTSFLLDENMAITELYIEVKNLYMARLELSELHNQAKVLQTALLVFFEHTRRRRYKPQV